jgi:hypothetical protein
MSNSSGLFTIVCTIALGGAILYLLQRIRHTDRQLKVLHSQARQIVDVGEIKTIVHKVIQNKAPSTTKLPSNFTEIVEKITLEKLKDATRNFRGETQEAEVEESQQRQEEVIAANTEIGSPTSLSFDDDEERGVVSGSIRRLAQQIEQ